MPQSSWRLWKAAWIRATARLKRAAVMRSDHHIFSACTKTVSPSANELSVIVCHRRRQCRAACGGFAAKWSVTSVFIATSTNRHEKIPGWRRSSRRIQPLPTTIGTSASPPSAMRPTAPRAFSTGREGSQKSPTTIRASASTSLPHCFPGWKRRRRGPTSRSSPPIVKAANRSPGMAPRWRKPTTI